jgi:pimeloyl-ACP methyl ester carboxylesterase
VASKLGVPSVLLQADFAAGGALSDEEARLFSQGAAQCKLKRFPGKNHQLHGTIPGEIAAEINRFLA